jgi:uncharacterized protein (DUF736 family)
MTGQRTNNLTGALFKNDEKQTETQPDYKGMCEIDRVQYWVAAWVNTSKAGQKYMALKFKPKMLNEQQTQPKPAPEPPPPPPPPFNDDWDTPF